MRRLWLCAGTLALFTVSVCADDTRVLTMDGLAPVRLGMTLKQAERALGATISVSYDANGSEACGEGWRKDNSDSGVDYMVEDGVVTRIDISVPGIRTAKGIGVGSTEAEVKTAYGRNLEIQPHPYLDETGHYLIVNSPGKKRGMIFETNEGKVTSFRAGLQPALGYIEGCA